MVATYIPGFTPELQNGAGRMGMLPGSLEEGGPAYAQMSPTVAPPAAPQTATGFGANVLNNTLATQTPAQPTAAQPAGLTFMTDRGRQAGYGMGSSGFVAFDPNAQYRMWDERGKNKIVSSGTGQSGLEAIYALTNQFNTDQGRKANWGVERLDPATGRWVRILENDPRSKVGQIAKTVAFPITNKTVRDVALPVAASFIPGVGPVLGAALGSAASSVIAGRSLKDTLLRAGLSAGTAGIFDKTGLSSKIGGALSGGAGNAASTAAGSALGSSATGFGSAVSGALGGALGQTGNQIIVNGVRAGVGSALGSALGAGAAALGGGALAAGLGGANGPGEIVVEGQRPVSVAGTPAIPLTQIPTNTPASQPDLQNPQRNTLDEIVKYLRAAGLLTNLVGGALGGGGGHGNGRIPNFGGLPSGFGGALPAPTMPGAATNFAPRPANFDWKRYGYGPGQSFFDYVPQGQPNTSNAYTGYAMGGEVEGGMPMAADSFAVQGQGTGRSDEIPALLSDGEYVFDAETVALLGDGSTKAGADALDQFRVNIRKHKGRQLAKGGFSPDAKPPEHYLYGGRT